MNSRIDISRRQIDERDQDLFKSADELDELQNVHLTMVEQTQLLEQELAQHKEDHAQLQDQFQILSEDTSRSNVLKSVTIEELKQIQHKEVISLVKKCAKND